MTFSSNQLENVDKVSLQQKHEDTVKKIQQLGVKYFKEHNWLSRHTIHTNGNIAKLFKDYNHPANDMAHHKAFLLKQLLLLPNLNGEIAADIQQLLATNFKINPTSEYLTQHLSVEILNELGQRYLIKHPESSFFHQSQPQAILLRDYKNSNASARECWNKLMEVYITLKPRSELAINIEKLVQNALGITLTVSEASGQVVLNLSTHTIAQKIKPQYERILKNTVECKDSDEYRSSLSPGYK